MDQADSLSLIVEIEILFYLFISQLNMSNNLLDEKINLFLFDMGVDISLFMSLHAEIKDKNWEEWFEFVNNKSKTGGSICVSLNINSIVNN